MITIKVTESGYSIGREPEILAKIPLAAAIRHAGKFAEPVTINIHGSLLHGIDIGGPSGYQNKDNCAFWDRPIENLTIQSGSRIFKSSISNLRFWNGLNGVKSITIKNLNIVNGQNEFAPVRTAMGSNHGHIIIENCSFKGTGSGWLGRGMKWGIRGHGPARWTITKCSFEPAQEHSIYIDNPQGDMLISECNGSKNGRTFMQVTNRPTSGPSQFGNITVTDCVCADINEDGGGGSDYTFVGCIGNLSVVNCSSFNTQNGAFVCWTDTTNGTYPISEREDFSFKNISVKNFTAISARARRPMFSISGAKYAELSGLSLDGGQVKMRFGGDYGGPRPNGNIEFK
jgi:hypothetical protein